MLQQKQKEFSVHKWSPVEKKPSNYKNLQINWQKNSEKKKKKKQQDQLKKNVADLFSSVNHTLGQAYLGCGGLVLRHSCLNNTTRFKSRQKWPENNHINWVFFLIKTPSICLVLTPSQFVIIWSFIE